MKVQCMQCIMVLQCTQIIQFNIFCILVQHHLIFFVQSTWQPAHIKAIWRRMTCNHVLKNFLICILHIYKKKKLSASYKPCRRNLMGDSILDRQQRPISLKGAGIQNSTQKKYDPVYFHFQEGPFRDIGCCYPSSKLSPVKFLLSFLGF